MSETQLKLDNVQLKRKLTTAMSLLSCAKDEIAHHKKVRREQELRLGVFDDMMLLFKSNLSRNYQSNVPDSLEAQIDSFIFNERHTIKEESDETDKVSGS